MTVMPPPLSRPAIPRARTPAVEDAGDALSALDAGGMRAMTAAELAAWTTASTTAVAVIARMMRSPAMRLFTGRSAAGDVAPKDLRNMRDGARATSRPTQAHCDMRALNATEIDPKVCAPPPGAYSAERRTRCQETASCPLPPAKPPYRSLTS